MQILVYTQIFERYICKYYLVYFCLTAKKPTVFTEQETNRIVGGFDTKGLLPYQLELKTRNEFYIYGCGGILISSRFGITADHCIDDTKYLKDAIVWAGAYKDPKRSIEGSVRHSCSTTGCPIEVVARDGLPF